MYDPATELAELKETKRLCLLTVERWKNYATVKCIVTIRFTDSAGGTDIKTVWIPVTSAEGDPLAVATAEVYEHFPGWYRDQHCWNVNPQDDRPFDVSDIVATLGAPPQYRHWGCWQFICPIDHRRTF